MGKLIGSDKEFAILVDSYCAVPEEYLRNYPIYVIPIELNDVNKVFERVINDGYTKIIAINIFDNLKDTYNIVQLVIDKYIADGIKFYHLDARDMAIANGLYAVSAGKYLKEGKSYEDTINILEEDYENMKAFLKFWDIFVKGAEQ